MPRNLTKMSVGQSGSGEPKGQSRSGSVPSDKTFGGNDIYDGTAEDQFRGSNRPGAEAWEGYMGQSSFAAIGYPDKDSAYPSDGDPELEMDPSNVID